MKVSVKGIFIKFIELVSETGVASEPHVYGDLLLTPEQEKVPFNERPCSEEGLAQAFLIGGNVWTGLHEYYVNVWTGLHEYYYILIGVHLFDNILFNNILG